MFRSILNWGGSSGGIEQLVSQATSVTLKTECYIDKILYGYIFLEVNGIIIDLKEYICEKNLAIHSDDFKTGTLFIVLKLKLHLYF